MNTFKKALKITLEFEGGFSGDTDDRGGNTRYGIRESVARLNGYQGPMMDFPLPFAEKIYKREYWDKLRLDEVAEFSPKIACKLFDIAVNLGIGQAAKFLQRSLNCLNRNQESFCNILVDGILGTKTICALKKCWQEQDKITIYKMLNIMQGAHYVAFCESVPSQRKFIRGWFKRISLE